MGDEVLVGWILDEPLSVGHVNQLRICFLRYVDQTGEIVRLDGRMTLAGSLLSSCPEPVVFWIAIGIDPNAIAVEKHPLRQTEGLCSVGGIGRVEEATTDGTAP